MRRSWQTLWGFGLAAVVIAGVLTAGVLPWALWHLGRALGLW
jgi:hypothetical protein